MQAYCRMISYFCKAVVICMVASDLVFCCCRSLWFSEGVWARWFRVLCRFVGCLCCACWCISAMSFVQMVVMVVRYSSHVGSCFLFINVLGSVVFNVFH